MEDNAIIALLFERDEAALDAAREKYGPYCSAIAAGILRDARDAEECVSDALLAAERGEPYVEAGGELCGFQGALGGAGRGDAVCKFLEGEDGLAAAALAAFGVAQGVEGAVAGEPAQVGAQARGPLGRDAVPEPQQRVAFVRRYWYLDSIGSLAARMGWSKSKTTSLLARLRASLRDRLISEGIEI